MATVINIEWDRPINHLRQSRAMITDALMIKRELGVCGIANIPNQHHHLASHTKFDFNILIMGKNDI